MSAASLQRLPRLSATRPFSSLCRGLLAELAGVSLAVHAFLCRTASMSAASLASAASTWCVANASLNGNRDK
jgi:hypothetical protein